MPSIQIYTRTRTRKKELDKGPEHV
jgi:hypothetical protein